MQAASAIQHGSALEEPGPGPRAQGPSALPLQSSLACREGEMSCTRESLLSRLVTHWEDMGPGLGLGDSKPTGSQFRQVSPPLS